MGGGLSTFWGLGLCVKIDKELVRYINQKRSPHKGAPMVRTLTHFSFGLTRRTQIKICARLQAGRHFLRPKLVEKTKNNPELVEGLFLV